MFTKKPQIKLLIKNLVLLCAGFCLLWVAFNNLPFNQLKQTLLQANYWLILPVFAVTLAGYFFRIMRWQMLLKGLNQYISLRTGFIAVSAGYLVSYVIPRGGEVTKCLIVKRYHQVPIHQSLISVVIERLADTLMLLMLIACIVLFNGTVVTQFFQVNIIAPLYAKISGSIMYLLIFTVVSLLLIFVLYQWLKKHSSGWVEQFNTGSKQLWKQQSKTTFLYQTGLIWLGYFLMTYLWIFAFSDSSSLTLNQVFIVMVVGTIGKSVPIQGGGMGAYHYLVAQVFLLFGVNLITGNALAIIIHGAQTLFTLLTGSAAYIVMLIDEKKRNL